jgi:uncharacterized protein (TIGR00369 family)
LQKIQLIKMDYIERIRSLGRSANPFFLLMGIELVSFGDGTAKLSMAVRPDMLNGAGWLQGGLFTAICDEAMALALFTVLDMGDTIATISESTSYLEGVKSGHIEATGRVIKKGRNVAFTEGDVTGSDSGHLLSQTRASFAVIGEQSGIKRPKTSQGRNSQG